MIHDDWIMRLPDDLEREWIEQVAQMEAEQHMQYGNSLNDLSMLRWQVNLWRNFLHNCLR